MPHKIEEIKREIFQDLRGKFYETKKEFNTIVLAYPLDCNMERIIEKSINSAKTSEKIQIISKNKIANYQLKLF